MRLLHSQKSVSNESDVEKMDVAVFFCVWVSFYIPISLSLIAVSLISFSLAAFKLNSYQH